MIFLTNLILVASLLLGDKQDEIPYRDKVHCAEVGGEGGIWSLGVMRVNPGKQYNILLLLLVDVGNLTGHR